MLAYVVVHDRGNGKPFITGASTYGGGGGGGRIAIYHNDTNHFTGQYLVNGGEGYAQWRSCHDFFSLQVLLHTEVVAAVAELPSTIMTPIISLGSTWLTVGKDIHSGAALAPCSSRIFLWIHHWRLSPLIMEVFR